MKAEIVKQEIENNPSEISLISTTCSMDMDPFRIDLSTINVDIDNNVLTFIDKFNKCQYIFDCKDINRIIR